MIVQMKIDELSSDGTGRFRREETRQSDYTGHMENWSQKYDRYVMNCQLVEFVRDFEFQMTADAKLMKISCSQQRSPDLPHTKLINSLNVASANK